jgi:Bacterial extracellular solute-binding proteins, family 5 Middle
MEGFSLPDKRSDRVVLEANLAYWDPARFPRLHRIIFDNTLNQKEALELVKTGEGRVDLVTGLSPLETLRVAQSPFAAVVKNRGALVTVFGQFNMRKAGSLWHDVRLRQAVNYAINREDLIRYATKGNGEIIPALIPIRGYGYDPDLLTRRTGTGMGTRRRMGDGARVEVEAGPEAICPERVTATSGKAALCSAGSSHTRSMTICVFNSAMYFGASRGASCSAQIFARRL